jgi:hypothetical protein
VRSPRWPRNTRRRATAGSVEEPDWTAPILASLAREDLASATLRGYRYDLRHFLADLAPRPSWPDPAAASHAHSAEGTAGQPAIVPPTRPSTLRAIR